MNLTKPRRIRDERYLAWVRTQPCLNGFLDGTRICFDPVEAHHVIPAGQGRVGSKVSDYRAVPLCRESHEFYHKEGRANFERIAKLDLEAEISRLNREYGWQYPAKSKAVKREPKTPTLTAYVFKCACGRSHKIPRSKVIQDVTGDLEFRCITTNKRYQAKVS